MAINTKEYEKTIAELQDETTKLKAYVIRLWMHCQKADTEIQMLRSIVAKMQEEKSYVGD